MKRYLFLFLLIYPLAMENLLLSIGEGALQPYDNSFSEIGYVVGDEENVPGDSLNNQSGEQLQESRNARDQQQDKIEKATNPIEHTAPGEKVKIKISGNRLVVENVPVSGMLEIYNIMGVKVYSRKVSVGANEYLLSLSRGYYIVKVGEVTRKIAIR